MKTSGLIAIAVSLLLSGCVATSGGPADGGLSAAGTVQLNQSLRIETGWARSFVQNGRPVLFHDRNKFDPLCSFEVGTVAREGMDIEIAPDTFVITRVQHKHIIGGIFPGVLDMEEDVGPVEPEVDIYLHSDTQPSVLRLRCATWEADAVFARPVRLDDVRGVLGAVADIR